MVARIGGREVVVGKFAFVAEHAPGRAHRDRAGELAVYVASTDARGALLARDRLRDNARGDALDGSACATP